MSAHKKKALRQFHLTHRFPLMALMMYTGDTTFTCYCTEVNKHPITFLMKNKIHNLLFKAPLFVISSQDL